ncbi:MAG: DUF86 domain-containing protein [Tenericutes bacterium]|nr:DUF86 domain-containing protein [Mycoplasmatota bacterium]
MKDKEYVERLMKYCSKIKNYMKPVKTLEDFISNSEKVDAVILNLEQIGETAKKVSSNTKNNYKKVNWPSIVGLRNMISHEYEGIKLEIIYEIAVIHIENLYIQLSKKQI